MIPLAISCIAYDCFNYPEIFVFPYEAKIVLSISGKNYTRFLKGILLTL